MLLAVNEPAELGADGPAEEGGGGEEAHGEQDRGDDEAGLDEADEQLIAQLADEALTDPPAPPVLPGPGASLRRSTRPESSSPAP
jgi:hypothetical protein